MMGCDRRRKIPVSHLKPDAVFPTIQGFARPTEPLPPDRLKGFIQEWLDGALSAELARKNAGIPGKLSAIA